MAWYAYCIAERQAFPELCRHRRPMPLTGVSGLFGNQTFLFPASDLAVIVSEHNPEDAAKIEQLAQPDGQQALKDHARVIADCFKHSTVLPFRFGTTFQDDDALRRSVRSNHRHFMANVERLRGKAEMHLKVLVDDTCPGNSARNMTVGQEYLTSLRESASRQRERQSKARALSIQMHRMFLPLAEEITCKRMESGKMLLDIAHLIDNKTVERYQNKYSSATQELKECRMQLSGPWPPYHFVQRSTPHHSHA
ncbi:MAG: Gas vesicle synthesis GvpLGvpF [Acidobacteriaceae bacterium]|nr:Gas vesicle synthesis GvpLGvpF [Acidobacteriaceae bacterium]